MDKSSAPPSYEAAVNSPPVNFSSPGTIPPTTTGFNAELYPNIPTAPYAAGGSASYPISGVPGPYQFGAGVGSYPAANATAPGFIPPQGDFKHKPYPTANDVTPNIPVHSQQVTQVLIHHLPTNFGNKSQATTCPQCKQGILTRIEVEPSTQTHLCALLMCAFGFWPCCCLPYCVDSCQKINHFCPNCGVYMGTYQS